MPDYRPTLNLFKSKFSLHNAADEATLLEFMASEYDQMAGSQIPGETFSLHDGPPYANGNIHMGHALNKVLKDIVTRSQYGGGSSIDFVPGWDCHGLPIEWQVEKNLIEQGKSRDDLTVSQFRQLCRVHAWTWIAAQKAQFKSLGVAADWDNQYQSTDYESEARIARKLHQLLMAGKLYRKKKPVMWSTVERTALAEAEIEYKDLKVTSAYIAYPISGSDESVDWMYRTRLLVWTTTPWTLPASLAIAFNPEIAYGIYEVDAITNGAKCAIGDRFIIADKLAAQTFQNVFVSEYHRTADVEPQYLVGRHPFRKPGYLWGLPLIRGEHVTDDTGTGLVHTAPDHGPEDFECYGARIGDYSDFPPPVNLDGTYNRHAPGFEGENILNQTPKGDYIFEFTNAKILKLLEERGNLIGNTKVTVSYPHSWRSGAPLIYKATPQWFMKIGDVRKKALKAIDDGDIEFYPASGLNRLRAALETRPDWLLSRQRVWGTPMAIFVHKETGEPLRSDFINENVSKAIAERGGDIWWEEDVAFFFGAMAETYNPDDYEKVMDVLDVWFDSGASYVQTIQNHKLPFDMYLEGSDQHRGWFGSSVLMGLATDRTIPFLNLVTHGFVLDKHGKKMSKSVGNVVDPIVEAKKYGTDVIRLWVALSDFTQDIRVGDEILKTTRDQYLRLRNTFKFLLDNLQDAKFFILTGVSTMEPLEKYMLVLLRNLRDDVAKAYREYRFSDAMKLVLDFCSNDLSAFYFDIRKDSLYCDGEWMPRRQGCQTVLFKTLEVLSSLLRPVLPFLVTEVDLEFAEIGNLELKDQIGSPWEYVSVPEVPGLDFNVWERVRALLAQVTPHLEAKRREGIIGANLDAQVTIRVPMNMFIEVQSNVVDLQDIFRVSQLSFLPFIKAEGSDQNRPIEIEVSRAEGKQCARSKKILPEVGVHDDYPDLSVRDAVVVRMWSHRNPDVTL